MSYKKLLLVLSLSSLTTVAAAQKSQKHLNYIVTNSSSATVYFKSTDLFDFGKIVHKDETKTITYDNPPKIMITAITSSSNSQGFDIITDISCDALGLPAIRQEKYVAKGEKVEGMEIQKAGNVHVTLEDMGDSTPDHLKLSCSIVKN